MALDPKTGNAIARRDLPPEYFGEGIVDWGPYILEWTWKSHICFVYGRLTLQPVTQFTYTGEGWGMTRTATELITSDGSATLRFRDPNTFQETHHIVVKDGGKVIDNLNELEFVKGEIYANIWHSDRIAQISPQDGQVIAWIGLTGLLPSAQRSTPKRSSTASLMIRNTTACSLREKSGPRYLRLRLFTALHQQPHSQRFH
jgi:glutamine cyclotransferase